MLIRVRRVQLLALSDADPCATSSTICQFYDLFQQLFGASECLAFEKVLLLSNIVKYYSLKYEQNC